MPNQSKINNPRYWAIWRNSGAIGTVRTAKHWNKMIKAINNAQGVEIIRDGESIRFIGHFSSGSRSEMILTLIEAANLIRSGKFKIPGVYGKILIETKMVRIWFKPVQNYDLVCLETRDFVRKLRRAL